MAAEPGLMLVTSSGLEVWQRGDKDLVQEQRTAVHLNAARQKATEVINIPERGTEKERE